MCLDFEVFLKLVENLWELLQNSLILLFHKFYRFTIVFIYYDRKFCGYELGECEIITLFRYGLCEK